MLLVEVPVLTRTSTLKVDPGLKRRLDGDKKILSLAANTLRGIARYKKVAIATMKGVVSFIYFIFLFCTLTIF